MINEVDISTFVELIDEARNPLSSQSLPGGKLGSSVAAIAGATQQVSSAHYEEVHRQICIEGGRPFAEMRALSGALVTRAVLSPELSRYRDWVRLLLYGTSSDKRFRPFSDRAHWITAIQVLDAAHDPLKNRSTDPSHLRGLEREVAVGNALKRLRARNVQFHFDGIHVVFESGELQRCCRDLDKLCGAAGGRAMISTLFRILQNAGRFKNGRYLLPRVSRPPAGGNTNAALPFGFLINIAYRHLHRTPISRRPAKTIQDAITLAIDIVSALDIESYSPYVHVFQNHESISRYLQEIVIADHVLAFRQMEPQIAIELMRGVFRWVDEAEAEATLGWKIADAITLAENLLASVPATGTNAIFARADLEADGISAANLSSMLGALSRDAGAVNRDYLTPLDAEKADAMFRPLVAVAKGRYLLVAPTLNSIGFYEAIAAAARTVWPDSDTRIGKAVEETLAEALKRRGISPAFVSRAYSMQSINGECDLIIECDQAVLLIEAKKKAITRRAHAGDALQTLIDLLSGPLTAQAQLGQHALLLQEFGHLEFVDGTRLELKGRRIERMAVTLLDWGGTQDRAVLRQIAQTLAGAGITGPRASASQTKSLLEGNATLQTLGRQVGEFSRLGVDPRTQFGNWWFLSVPQLLFAANGASDANELYARLCRIKGTVTGTLDFYQDMITYGRV